MKHWILVVGIVLGVLFAPVSYGQTDLLPDLVIDQDLLLDYEFVNDIIPGWVHIRLTNAVANIGLGPMRVLPDVGDIGTLRQPILQRISVDNNGDLEEDTFFDRVAGEFIFHPSHDHFHVAAWAQMRIREVLPGDGVGDILFTGHKTSFCLLDSARYFGEPALGNVNSFRTFRFCESGIQGVSVGWEDIYTKELPDQWINISGMGPGEYWIESEADPNNVILELDETNNIARVKITVTAGEIPAAIPVRIQTRFLVLLMCMLMVMGAIQLRGLSLQWERD